jgi:hypothetical protein
MSDEQAREMFEDLVRKQHQKALAEERDHPRVPSRLCPLCRTRMEKLLREVQRYLDEHGDGPDDR